MTVPDSVTAGAGAGAGAGAVLVVSNLSKTSSLLVASGFAGSGLGSDLGGSDFTGSGCGFAAEKLEDRIAFESTQMVRHFADVDHAIARIGIRKPIGFPSHSVLVQFRQW